MASMYLRGRMWWGKWSNQGRTVRQSLKTQDKREARRRLRELEAQTAGGERQDIQTTSRETWDAAAADLLTYYQAYGTRDPVEAGYKIKKLTKHFGGTLLAAVDASAIAEYV